LQYTFSGMKGNIEEGGHRVPFGVRWPARIKPGTICKDVICLNDFMATVADLLGVPLPENAAEDSSSILPLLDGTKNVLTDRSLVVNHDYKGGFAIRKGKWKLVEAKLFDLDTDPKELKDVANEFPEIVKELASTLERYQESGRSRK
jgi:arylsulfatase A